MLLHLVCLFNMHRENDANHVPRYDHVLVSTTTALHNALRPCNLHSPLSLRINHRYGINAIVDDHVAVVFAKLPIISVV
jgi:hypothetical protein